MSTDVRPRYKSPEALRILDAYYDCKARLLASAGAKPLTTPDEWAGSMLVVFGQDALAKIATAVFPIPHLPAVRALVTAALNAELAIEYPEIACSMCDADGPPTMAWKSRGRPGAALWACPVCAPGVMRAEESPA